jgi:hypothetical protein
LGTDRPEPPTRDRTVELQKAAWASKKEMIYADGSGALHIIRHIAPWSLLMVREQ